jgi:ribosome-associated translation inhibitor RaiA
MDTRALEPRGATDLGLTVVRHGAGIDDATVAYAKEKIAVAAKAAPERVLFGRIKITHEPDPSLERPMIVSVTLDVNGHPVRAHVAARTLRDAIDLVEERTRRQLSDARHRIAFLRRRHTGIAAPGEWRHGDEPTVRPDSFVRPPEEREVVRTKRYQLGRCTPEEAVVLMEMLDHDFHLFVDESTGSDAVVRRLPDGGSEISLAIEGEPAEGEGPPLRTGSRPPTLETASAVERLNQTDEPFLFYVDPRTARGAVLYRRSDGHYGIVEAGPTDR